MRSRARRRQAAGLLELALRHDELAADTAAGRLSCFGSVAYLEKRAVDLRAMADEALLGLPR